MSNKPLTSRRILTLDLLRGWFLVAILLDHLQYYPNGFDLLTGRGDLYVSAAEGFFLISGIVLGVVRGRKLLEKPFKVAAKLLLKRGVQLYITAIVLFFVFTFIGWNFMDNPGLKPGIRPIDQNFFDILKGALNFDYIYGWADYLRLYAIYLFVSPVVVWLLRKGLWYIVAIASIGVWFYYDSSTLPTNELSQVYSWQTIFFGGMIAGFYIDQIKDWWHRRSETFRKWAVTSVVAAALVTVIANMTIKLFGGALFGDDVASTINSNLLPYFNKERLPVARIALFAVWFMASFWLFYRYEKLIMRRLGWILIPFGTNSLYIYTIEAFVIFFIHLFIPPDGSNDVIAHLTLSIFCIFLVWLAIRFKFLAKIIPR